ncbi:MAG: hypothetical protein P8J45_10925 [Phycisphaerales bacterium]|jgi:hypothetical protein|nr:hypothetical protein [Phycisphaerales bacterium]
MGRFIPLSCLGCALLLAGCSNTAPDRYPVIEAFHPDGSGGGITPDRDALKNMEAVVLSYAPGDIIEISVNLASDVMHTETPVTITLVVDRPIRVATDSDGMQVSIDGGPWESPLKAFKGSFTTGLSTSKKEQANRGQMDLTAYKR